MNLNLWKRLLFAVFVVAPIAWIIKLDQQYEYDKNHPTAEKEAHSQEEKKAQKYPPGARDTKMRNAIKAHNVPQISRLLEGHDLTMAKSKQNKAYRRFTKGLYGGWDWELCKQLSPRLGISLFWTLFFNPFYFLSTYSAFQFLKVPLNLVGYGLTVFFYAMQFIGFATGGDRLFAQQLKDSISRRYWPCLRFANILYMLYRIHTDIKSPSYLMMILTNDQFTAEEKKSLQEKFYAKIAADKDPKYKPDAMQTYGIICTQHKATPSIENLLKQLEARLQLRDEENKPRGRAWIMCIWLPRLVCRALRAGIFYSGLSFTYIALPASSDDTYKMATYKDNISLNVDEFFIKDEKSNEKRPDDAKLMWKIVTLIWAVCLHSGLPSEYQLPKVQAQAK